MADLLRQYPVENQMRRWTEEEYSQLAECRIRCTDSDTADTSPLDCAQDEKMQTQPSCER